MPYYVSEGNIKFVRCSSKGAMDIPELGGHFEGFNTEEERNSINVFDYQEPSLTEFQKKGVLIKVENKVTNEAVEMTPLEKKIKQLKWEFEDLPIRVTVSANLVEETSGSADPNLIAFRNVLRTRQCKEVYDKTGIRSYSVYLSGWYDNEKQLLESLDNYSTWIANGATKTQPYMIINELDTYTLIVE